MRLKSVSASLVCLGAASLSACTSMVDDARNYVEGAPTTMAEALANQEQALNDGCLASIFGATPLRTIMTQQGNAKEVPPKDTGSPTAVAAWRLDSNNTTYVMDLPGGACSLSVRMGDPQQLYDAGVALIQTRGVFVEGMTDTAERGDALRTVWCTAGPYPHVAVFYKRTTGRRDAFLANVFKAQGATLSACRAG